MTGTRRDRWQARGDRVAIGEPAIAELMSRRPARWAVRPAREFRQMAEQLRADAHAELAKAIRGTAMGRWFGIPAARRHLHVAAEYSTIAANLELLANPPRTKSPLGARDG